MTGSQDLKGLAVPLEELHVEASPSSPPRGEEIDGVSDAAAADDICDDASDCEEHVSILDREWVHRQNRILKMGYRDGITEGKKDAAQEGFTVGFRQSVHVGYKWGLARGLTSALDSLPRSLKEKLSLDDQCRGKLKDLHNSVLEISAEGALQLFHESTLQDNRPPEESRLQLFETIFFCCCTNAQMFKFVKRCHKFRD